MMRPPMPMNASTSPSRSSARTLVIVIGLKMRLTIGCLIGICRPTCSSSFMSINDLEMLIVSGPKTAKPVTPAIINATIEPAILTPLDTRRAGPAPEPTLMVLSVDDRSAGNRLQYELISSEIGGATSSASEESVDDGEKSRGVLLVRIVAEPRHNHNLAVGQRVLEPLLGRQRHDRAA